MQGIYFKKVSIDNAFCFHPQQQLSFVNEQGDWFRWTVLLGENGTGKTTLLQLLATMEMQVISYRSDGKIDFSPSTDAFLSTGQNKPGPNAKVTVELMQHDRKLLPPIKLQFSNFNIFGQPVFNDPIFG